jgi:ADP-ribose pyrophosphatase YjhB (NUDIX family)
MSTRWKPNVTVAAIIEREGRFMLVEEHTSEGLRLNNPAGHLDCGETPEQACAREALEETAHAFTPSALVGVYLSRVPRIATGDDITYLRFAFSGELGAFDAQRALDDGIVRTLCGAEDAVGELAVGQRGKQRHHRAQVHAQQQRPGRRAPQPSAPGRWRW